MLCAASFGLRGEEPAAAIGKQRAARLAVAWDVRDIDHSLLGPIRFAVQKNALATAAGSDRILSQVFVSCQKNLGTIAIELTNAAASDPAGGLRPMETPRLVCRSPGPAGDGGLVRSDLAAKWEINALGDALARGLSPSELRRCASIEVLQSVAPPPGSPQKSQPIPMEVTPYDRAIDSVFAACGEKSAFSSREPAPPAAAPAARSESAPERSPGAATSSGAWKPARTVAKGKTNVRAAPDVDAAIVATLDPGTKVRVRPASMPWWEARPRSGEGFRGYIRQDRLALE
jgi:hypothetical protein